MTVPLLILRPKEGAEATAGRAQNLGLDAIVDPLFAIKPLAWNSPLADGYDGLLLTSSNAVKYAGEQLSDYRDLPVLAVGETTAAAAAEAGFAVDIVGEKGVQSLVAGISKAQYSKLLWLAGEHHTAIATDSVPVTIISVYQTVALTLGSQAQACLKSGTVAALHSVRAAQILCEQMDQLGLDKRKSHIIAFSPAVAQAAGLGWKSLTAAAKPSDGALLSIAAGLCLEPI